MVVWAETRSERVSAPTFVASAFATALDCSFSPGSGLELAPVWRPILPFFSDFAAEEFAAKYYDQHVIMLVFR